MWPCVIRHCFLTTFLSSTLCNPTPCLFRHKIPLPVHVGLDRFHCIHVDNKRPIIYSDASCLRVIALCKCGLLPHVSGPRNTAPAEAVHRPGLGWSPALHNTVCRKPQCPSSSADTLHGPTGQSSQGNSGPSTVCTL